MTQIKDNTVEKLAIFKNNKVEAVIISKDEYENMKEALKQVESKNILQSIQSGLDDMKNGKTNQLTNYGMSFNIEYTDNFLKEAKQLSKKLNYQRKTFKT